MNLKKYHELLVPVGNYESLIQAINNGADAVYLGGKKFGARAFAENFTLDKIEEATKLCHLYGVKIYITVNTLVYESEIDEALEYCKELHKIGVDALIMQDVGLINLVHQTIPNMVINPHAKKAAAYTHTKILGNVPPFPFTNFLILSVNGLIIFMRHLLQNLFFDLVEETISAKPFVRSVHLLGAFYFSLRYRSFLAAVIVVHLQYSVPQ